MSCREKKTNVMKKVQVLQNVADKIFLDMPKHSSASEELDQIGWDNLMKRKKISWIDFVF